MFKNSAILLAILTTVSIQADIDIPESLYNVCEQPEEFIAEIEQYGSPDKWLKAQSFFMQKDVDVTRLLVKDIIPFREQKMRSRIEGTKAFATFCYVQYLMALGIFSAPLIFDLKNYKAEAFGIAACAAILPAIYKDAKIDEYTRLPWKVINNLNEIRELLSGYLKLTA